MNGDQDGTVADHALSAARHAGDETTRIERRLDNVVSALHLLLTLLKHREVIKPQEVESLETWFRKDL